MYKVLAIITIIAFLIFGSIASIYIYLEATTNHPEPIGEQYYYFDCVDIYFDTMGFCGKSIFKRENDVGYVPIIYPDVTDYVSDSTHILIAQELNDQQTIELLQGIFLFDRGFGISEKFKPKLDTLQKHFPRGNSHNEKAYIANYVDTSSYFQKHKHQGTNYFIIEKNSDYVYGPMDKITFKRKKDSLGILLQFD